MSPLPAPVAGTVLQEAANTSETTLPLERSVIDTSSDPNGDTVYSPLSLLVGTNTPTSYTTGRFFGHITGEYSGDLRWGPRKRDRILRQERGGSSARRRRSGADAIHERTRRDGDRCDAGASEHTCGTGDTAESDSERTGTGRCDVRLFRVPGGRVLRRVWRPPQRARPARPGILQLGRPGERPSRKRRKTSPTPTCTRTEPRPPTSPSRCSYRTPDTASC